MTPEEIREFRYAYNCTLHDSKHQYARPITRPFLPDANDPIDQTFQVEYQTGIDVTFMHEHFHQMVADAAEGRERRSIREWHPAVREAYDHYQQLLYLTRMNK